MLKWIIAALFISSFNSFAQIDDSQFNGMKLSSIYSRGFIIRAKVLQQSGIVLPANSASVWITDITTCGMYFKTVTKTDRIFKAGKSFDFTRMEQVAGYVYLHTNAEKEKSLELLYHKATPDTTFGDLKMICPLEFSVIVNEELEEA